MATLTVTITESVTLNGAARGSTNSLSVTGINDIYHRIVSCPDDVPLSLATFKSTVGAGDTADLATNLVDLELAKYIRVTNLSSSHPIVLNLLVDTNQNDTVSEKSCSLKVEAGKSFVMGTPDQAIDVDDDANTQNTDVTALVDLRSIHVDPISEAVQVEIFIASA